MKLNIILNTECDIEKEFFQNVFDITFEELSNEDIDSALLKNKDLEINFVITGDEEVKDLNKKWRDKDSTTDVLSFPYEEANSGVFGEIFVSLPQCEKQAKELEHSLEKELSILFVHGILHLFAYDHISDDDFLEMNLLEEKIKKRLSHD